MPEELILYITKYGYLTIFALVFLQEIGVPNPVPNELVLLFAGYLAWSGRFNIILLLFIVVAADFLGTALLYFVFYHFGERLLKKTPKWFPIRKEKLTRLEKLISSRGFWGMYLGRLIPYVRGYASIAAGLLEMPPKKFLGAVILSALTWSGGYVIAGRLLGPRWESIKEYFGSINAVIIFIIFVIAAVYFGPILYRRLRRGRSNVS